MGLLITFKLRALLTFIVIHTNNFKLLPLITQPLSLKSYDNLTKGQVRFSNQRVQMLALSSCLVQNFYYGYPLQHHSFKGLFTNYVDSKGEG